MDLGKGDCVGDAGCSNNEKKPDNLILAEWTSLPSSFPAVKKFASPLLTVFGSTYLCEKMLSSLNFVKSSVRRHLGVDISAACVQLKITDC